MYRNFALQGEYAELERTGSNWKIGDDPHAMVLNAYVQQENLNVLMVYRDYDVTLGSQIFGQGCHQDPRARETVGDNDQRIRTAIEIGHREENIGDADFFVAPFGQ